MVMETKVTTLPYPIMPTLKTACGSQLYPMGRGPWWGASYQQNHSRNTSEAGRAPPLGTWPHSVQPMGTTLGEGGRTY